MKRLTIIGLLVAGMVYGLASPVLAVVPTAGDLFWFAPLGGELFHFDAETGVTSSVSCWNTAGAPCTTPIGTGPDIVIIPGSDEIHIGPDGWIYFTANFDQSFGASGAVRIDPVTGNRETVVEIPSSFVAVWPAASFFPVSVASLGTWGLAMLVVGIFIGVQLRLRRTAEV